MNEPIIPQIIPLPNNQVSDITGQRFGRLLVIRYAGSVKKRARWLCLCDCGQSATVDGKYLRSKKTTSCGCVRREKTGEARRTHGMSQSSEYRTWAGIHSRCKNAGEERFPDYGGRGIKVCDRWEIFENFFEDMGHKPTPKHSIDRIDVNGPYSPENCRWATAKEQNNNKRTNHIIEFGGVSMNITQWAEHLGINRRTLTDRMDCGWTIERTLSTPARRQKSVK